MTNNGLMTVGQLSRRTGVPIKALRQYTDWGLIYTVGRSATNYRLFDSDALRCVQFITQLRGLGLTVAEIRQLTRAEAPIGPRLADLLHQSRARLSARITELRQTLGRIDEFETAHHSQLALRTRSDPMTEPLDVDLNKASAALALSPPARQVHQWVLTAFAETGRAPRRAALERMAAERGIDPGTALTELTGRDVLAVGEHGEIRAAYPFSPVPTRHQVTWDGGPTVHAMCAIDALGMSAMLDVPVTIISAEPGTDRTITVHVDHDTARWSPSTAVVLAGATGDACCPSVDRTCGHINFFTTPDAAHAWTEDNSGVTGAVLDQDQALACGIAEFATLLRPTTRTDTADLEQFDQGWLAAMEQTPFVRAIIALSGLTRLGEHPASLERFATILDRSLDQTAALVRTEFTARIQDGLIYWDDPYPGEHTRRLVHVGHRTVPMGSGCGPDVFTFAAVFDVPFRIEETCPTTGKLIQVDFVPGGYQRVDPPEAVTMLWHPKDFAAAVGGHFTEINAAVCTYQPFFASAEAAQPALEAFPGARAFTVPDMLARPWFRHYRDTLRPLIHPAEAGEFKN